MNIEKEYEEMSVEEKVQKIDESSSLRDLPAWALPPVPIIRPDTYFFISYSHKDYKKVYKDIFELQAQGINIWYDGGMPVGKSWQEVADEYIRPYKCAGVIFYVSENSLMSEAIHKEMEFAKDNGKMCITINLPVESVFTYNGESVQGKEIAAQALLDVLRERGRDEEERVITDEKYQAISEMFGYNVLFMPYSTLPENKKKQILDAYKKHKEPLLLFEETDDEGVAVVGIKDISVRKISNEDFSYCNKNGNVLPVVEINPCAFANCMNLESIDLPENLVRIGEFAFWCCRNLQNIKIPIGVNYIGLWAFAECNKLIDLVIPDSVTTIMHGAFCSCLGLERIELSKNLNYIGLSAFGDCSSITDITVPDSVTDIWEDAFNGCSGLMRLKIGEGVKSIGDFAFYGSHKLAYVIIPDNVEHIGDKAFGDCKSLTDITIGKGVRYIGERAFFGYSGLVHFYCSGTIDKWGSIIKDEDWDSGLSDYIIHCADGDFRKGEF